jgi:hypothetical protein
MSGSGPTPATRPAGPSAQDQALAQAMRELAEQRRKLLEQQQKEQQAALGFAVAVRWAPSFVINDIYGIQRRRRCRRW